MNAAAMVPSVRVSSPPSRVRPTASGRLRFLLALAVGVFAAACNTIEGAGKDVESVGSSTSEASRDVRDK
jgi:predicted small secreted protein